MRHAATSIATNLDDALDVGGLARQAGLSVSRFERVFRATLTESPAALHRRLRLERAALELSVTDVPVTMIALRAGYETHESFTRAFQRAYKFAPTAFRIRMHVHRSRNGTLTDIPYRLPSATSIHVDARQVVLPSPVPLRGGTTMPVQITDRRPARLAAVAHEGPYNMIGEAFAMLARIAEPVVLFARAGAVGIAVFPSFEGEVHTATPYVAAHVGAFAPYGIGAFVMAADARGAGESGDGAAFAGVVVDEDVSIPDGAIEIELPGGPYATATHVGSYATLPDAWQGLALDVADAVELVLDSGRPSFEVYRVADHTEPSSLETDLFLPVRRAEGDDYAGDGGA